MSNIKVLHIVTDYPDHTHYNNTKAVKNLLLATEGEIDHTVVALRRLKRFKFIFERFDDYFYFQVPSFPFGLFHVLTSFIYAVILSKKLKKHCVQFNVIHAHKLTIDGLVAFFLSKIMRVKYVLSIRADTDLKFINNKPFSKWIFRMVFKDAKHIYWVSAWAKNVINNKLSYRPVSESYLANIVTGDFFHDFSEESILVAKKFIFVGRLESANKKGLLDVIKVLKNFPELSLDVYGPSSINVTERIFKYIKDLDMEDQVKLMGTLPKEKLVLEYKNYCALLMPSKNETFGMVYVEALLNGLPILCCKKSGVDGYVKGSDYFRTVSFGDVEDIGKNIEQLYINQCAIKNKLAKDNVNGKLDFFKRESIKKSYISRLLNVK